MNLSDSRWAPAGGDNRNTPPTAVFRDDRISSLSLATQESTNDTGKFDDDYDMEYMHHDPDDTCDYTNDTAMDDDGDVVMVDLNDPGIITMVTELTRNERQAENISNYSDLKPGLRPAVSKTRIPKPSCLLIIDTNFIISHLQLVDNLVRSHPRWKNVVVMPWATIQELDGLKKSLHKQNGVDLGKLARNAINWAFEVFAKCDPGVWGQTKEECEDSYVRGDAAILECCRYFKNIHETVLLSNDKNLCIQAMIHNIKTVSKVGEMHTAETILTRILGNSIDLPELAETAVGPREPPGPNLEYKRVPNYTPYSHKNHRASMNRIHQSPDTSGETDRSRGGDITRSITPKIPKGNGLEASIYATTTTTTTTTTTMSPQRPRYDSQPNISRRSPRTPSSILGASKNGDSEKIKNNLNFLLQRISTDLVIILVPLLKQCVQSKLVGVTASTLEALNYHLEEQVRDIIGLESFFHTYWASVFREYLPADYGDVFRGGDLSRCWSGWIQWTVIKGSDLAGPKYKEVKRWIDQWDFIWKRLIFTAGEANVNIETTDRWRTALVSVGLAAE